MKDLVVVVNMKFSFYICTFLKSLFNHTMMMKCYFWFLFELCSKPLYMFLQIYERAVIARYGVHWKTNGVHIYSFHTVQIIKISKGCPIISFKIKTSKNVLLFNVYWWETGKYWSCYRFYTGKKESLKGNSAMHFHY